MICRKCGHANPDEVLFCEECDHRLDQPYRKEKTTFPPLYAVIIALAMGAVGVIMAVMKQEWYFAAIPGAFGIFLGSYSLRIAGTMTGNQRQMMFILSVTALILAVAGFMLGILMFGE
jgi:predicted nucleic acid-binding Zn ribbon protein